MAKVEVSVPDELLARAQAARLDVSELASAAVAEELDRLAKIAELDAYLADLDRTLGPPSEQEVEDAREWAHQFDGPSVQIRGPVRPRPASP